MNIKHYKILNITLICIILFLVRGSSVDGINYSDAGTATDPLVTLNYVEGRLTTINDDIDKRLLALESKTASEGLLSYEVVEVQAGQIINLEENTQFILRSGEATAIGGPGGGLSDLTTGLDLKTGDLLVLNHLLLIPRSDGRGVKMTTYGWVMISGKYTIQ